MSKFRLVDRETGFLMPPSVDEWLPERHLARFVVAMEQPEGARYELFAGEVVPKAAERVAHGRAKGQIFRAFSEALELAGLSCEVFVDGMAVPIDAETTYEPNVLVRSGVPWP